MGPQPRAPVPANLLGPAVAAPLVLIPEPLYAFATDPKALANLPGARAAMIRRRKSSLNGLMNVSS